MLFIATLISKLFEPALVLAVAFLAGSVASGLTFTASIVWMFVLMGPTVIYRLWAKKTKGLDWDMHERTDRIVPFLYLLGFLVCTGLILYVFEPRLLSLFFLCFIWTIGFFLITAFWTKISGHVGGDMLAIGVILRWYGTSWWPLLLVIPLVGWARIVRRDHTLLQVVLGFMYSCIILLAFRQ